MSPPLADNPQAFAFRSNDDLRHVLNPQIIRMRVDPEAAAFMEQLTVKFFPEPDATCADERCVFFPSHRRRAKKMFVLSLF